MEPNWNAQLVLNCPSLNEMINFFKDELKFRVDTIYPADDPSTAIMSGYGMCIRLERSDLAVSDSCCTIRLSSIDSNVTRDEKTEKVAPNGTKIELVRSSPNIFIPELVSSFVVSKLDSTTRWIRGRAGMEYRDLIPGRQGGRFIASHIRILDGGPVPDQVHYHHVRFQLIYIYKGWVRLVYQDQGSSFILKHGDCVLQPPTIRHRVLESSPGLEVIELACPAVHDTHLDHTMELPNKNISSNLYYGGQRFVKYIAENDAVEWEPWRITDFQCRRMGIGDATAGLGEMRFVRAKKFIESNPNCYQHSGEFVFMFILNGTLTITIVGEKDVQLSTGDACVLKENQTYSFLHWSDELQLLEVTLPATISTMINNDSSSN